tara:strand:+ start:480 stop:632 length:153 start_codon:yes stop_codon:yes gene_type:complete
MFFMIAMIIVLMVTIGNPEMNGYEMNQNEVQEDLDEISELLNDINEEKKE